jgi:hypothetical protein
MVVSGLQATFQTERARLGRLGRRPESGNVEVEGAMITVIDNSVLDRRSSSCICTMGEEAQRQVMA